MVKLAGTTFDGLPVPNAAFALSSSAVAHTATIRREHQCGDQPGGEPWLSRSVTCASSTSGSCSAVTSHLVDDRRPEPRALAAGEQRRGLLLTRVDRHHRAVELQLERGFRSREARTDISDGALPRFCSVTR